MPNQTPLPLGLTAFKYSALTTFRQRIEIYRKLAQASDKLSLQRLAEEMRDRFGPLPPAMELLLQLAELKLLASERGHHGH